MYNGDIKEYFEKTVIKYSKTDVQRLLEAKLDCAGPLLTVIFNGIDNLGGLCYGYQENNSRARSIQFMKKKMNIPEALTDFLYSAIRCGITHQGAPKLGLRFFVYYKRIDPGKIFYKEANYISMNVVELAYFYLDVIEKIASDSEKHIHFLPGPMDKGKDVFNQAKLTIPDDFSIFCYKAFIESKESTSPKFNRNNLIISTSAAYASDNITFEEIATLEIPFINNI